MEIMQLTKRNGP